MPLYKLEDIQEKAKSDSINYSKNATKSRNRLKYTREDVCVCLGSLTEQNFKETKEYINNGISTRLDVYLITFSNESTDTVDELYIKLKFNGWIVIESFHL